MHSNKPHKSKAASWYLVVALIPHTSTTTATATTKSAGKQQQQGSWESEGNVFNTHLKLKSAFNSGGDLLALKQIGTMEATASECEVSVTFQLPELEELLGAPAQELVIALVCDSFCGLDYAFKLPLNIE